MFETLSGIRRGLNAAPPRLLIIDSFVKAIARWDSENDAFGCQPLLGLAEGAADPLLGGGGAAVKVETPTRS